MSSNSAYATATEQLSSLVLLCRCQKSSRRVYEPQEVSMLLRFDQGGRLLLDGIFTKLCPTSFCYSTTAAHANNAAAMACLLTLTDGLTGENDIGVKARSQQL